MGILKLESEFPFNPEKEIYSNLKFMSKPSDPFARWYRGRVDGATRPMENIKTLHTCEKERYRDLPDIWVAPGSTDSSSAPVIDTG